MAAKKKLTIKIKVFDEKCRPEKIAVGDWIDLKNREKINLLGPGLKLVPLGIAMELPDGYEAHIVPRGSTFKNFGLIQTNHMGVVDNSYNGPGDEWFWPCLKMESRPYMNYVPEGTRVAQFRIVEKQPEFDFEDSDLEHNTDRGGHGSTGV